jgi:acyl-CoA thioesterase
MFIIQAFDEFLGLKCEKISEGRVKVTLPVKPLYINSAGVIHGGIISSLADVAMCNTVGADENNIQKVVTVDLNVTFLKGAKAEYLVADAQVTKGGRSLTHADCLIYDDQENLVAKAKAILFNT